MMPPPTTPTASAMLLLVPGCPPAASRSLHGRPGRDRGPYTFRWAGIRRTSPRAGPRCVSGGQDADGAPSPHQVGGANDQWEDDTRRPPRVSDLRVQGAADLQ